MSSSPGRPKPNRPYGFRFQPIVFVRSSHCFFVAAPILEVRNWRLSLTPLFVCKIHSFWLMHVLGRKDAFQWWRSELSVTMLTHIGQQWIPLAPLKSNASLRAFSSAINVVQFANLIYVSSLIRIWKPALTSCGSTKSIKAAFTKADMPPLTLLTLSLLASPKVNQSWSTCTPGPCLNAQYRIWILRVDSWRNWFPGETSSA